MNKRQGRAGNPSAMAAFLEGAAATIGGMVAERLSSGNGKRYRNSGEMDGETEQEALARDLAERFHGRDVREVIEVTEEEADEDTLSGLGDLVELLIVPKRGSTPISIYWDPNDDRPLLCSTPDGQQLVIVGGEQWLDLENDEQIQAAELYDGATGKNMVLIGHIESIAYFADKHHLEGDEDQADGVEYEHQFGEEGGEMPVLAYMPDIERMIIIGGSYEVRDEGIWN